MNNKSTAALVAALASAGSAFAQIPTTTISSQTSYIESTRAGWSATPLITVGDTVGGYSMVGIPDGLGAYSSGSNVTILMNHEIGTTGTAPNVTVLGAVRAHGSAGAFVSEWTLNKNTLAITAGKDLIQSASDVFTWNGTAYTAGTTAFLRLCSADLPSASAFYDSGTSTGYNGRIFMNGEEAGNEGRAFGFVATGASAGSVYELPKLGKFSWENSVARPTPGATTAVIGLDDTTPGQVYLYLGTKSATGNAVEQAGLNNGSLYGIKVAGTPLEVSATHNTTGAVGSFTLEQINTSVTGAKQQTESVTDGVTEFARPEDGQWVDADTFVFVTTGSPDGGTAKLYSVDFSNANNLLAGGTVSLVLNSASLTGTDGQVARSFDNLTVGFDGKVYIQEDPGGNSYIAKIWQVDFSNPTGAVQIFESDRDRFLAPTAPFTQDEEHSGIIDVTNLFNGVEGTAASWYVSGMQVFLSDTQAHYTPTTNAATLVEGGQLQLLVFNPSAIPEPSSFAALAGLAGLGFAASRRRRRA